MDDREFEEYIAQLCRRDGCTDVKRVGGAGDLGADVIGRLPDGRKVVIQCKRYAKHRTVGSRDIQTFNGTARAEHGAEVPVFVASCVFTDPARKFAARQHLLPEPQRLRPEQVGGGHLHQLPERRGPCVPQRQGPQERRRSGFRGDSGRSGRELSHIRLPSRCAPQPGLNADGHEVTADPRGDLRGPAAEHPEVGGCLGHPDRRGRAHWA
ncbi:restriction endonuclease [Streptomyces sp. R-74717]